MTLRHKIPIIVFYLFSGVGLVEMLISKFQTEGVGNLNNWVLLACGLFMVPGCLFVFPTFRVKLNETGLTATFQLGYGKLSVYNYHKFTCWDDIRLVINWLPVWFPIRLYNVNGLWMGSQLTRQKAALLYIADHVKSDVLDEEAIRIVAKYRKQQQKK